MPWTNFTVMKNDIAITKNYLLSFVQPTTAELVMLLVNQDKIELAQFERQINLQKAIDGTTLRKLSKTLDNKNLTKILVFLITRFSANFNVGKKFNEEQAIIMAMDLIDSFGYETIEDVLLMFKMARTGRIGDGKDFKLDSQTVFHKWIPEYLELKIDYRQQLHNRQKELIKENTLTLADVKKEYNKLSAQQKENKINERIDEITKGFTREMLENLIVQWQNDDTKTKYLRYLTKKRLTIK